jgi:hypothetical protein
VCIHIICMISHADVIEGAAHCGRDPRNLHATAHIHTHIHTHTHTRTHTHTHTHTRIHTLLHTYTSNCTHTGTSCSCTHTGTSCSCLSSFRVFFLLLVHGLMLAFMFYNLALVKNTCPPCASCGPVPECAPCGPVPVCAKCAPVPVYEPCATVQAWQLHITPNISVPVCDECPLPIKMPICDECPPPVQCPKYDKHYDNCASLWAEAGD